MTSQKPCPRCGKAISIYAKLCLECKVDERSGCLTRDYKYNPAMVTAGDGFFDSPQNGHKAGDYWSEQEKESGF